MSERKILWPGYNTRLEVVNSHGERLVFPDKEATATETGDGSLAVYVGTGGFYPIARYAVGGWTSYRYLDAE